jgi:hypothetical protein
MVTNSELHELLKLLQSAENEFWRTNSVSAHCLWAVES